MRPDDYRETEDILGTGGIGEEHFEEPYFGVCHTCRHFGGIGGDDRCHNPRWNVGKNGMRMNPSPRKTCKGYEPLKERAD